MRCGIGLDLGGSSLKAGLVSEQGAVLAERRVALEVGERAGCLEVIAEAIAQLREQAAVAGWEVSAIGCGVSGYLDPKRSRIELNNIPALDGFALGPWMRERFGLPVALDNDACVAALAETALLDPGEFRRVLFVTVGSGIGVVLVVDGAVVRLTHGVTGDAGHILVDPQSQERCPIGCRGCLETVATARAIARAGQRAAEGGESERLAMALRSQGELTAADVSIAAREGDTTAQEILRQAGHWLGVGLASWAPIYAPELILLGGGVAGAGEGWLGAAVAAMRENGHPFFVQRIKAVRLARLGNQAGVIGAGLLALQEKGGSTAETQRTRRSSANNANRRE